MTVFTTFSLPSSIDFSKDGGKLDSSALFHHKHHYIKYMLKDDVQMLLPVLLDNHLNNAMDSFFKQYSSLFSSKNL